MATAETIALNDPHPPRDNAIEAFNIILPTMKSEIIKSRHHWNKHEPRMWSRAHGLSDAELTNFSIEQDLVQESVRSAATSYGTIILGKIRIPAVNDEEGEGFVHVRIHDPPNRGAEDVTFHSLFTDEQRVDDQVVNWRAVQTADTPLEFFNE